MNSNIVILVVLVLLIICVSQNNSKTNKNPLVDNSMLLLLLVFGIIIFFVYRDFNNTTESFYNGLGGINVRNKNCNVNKNYKQTDLYKLVNPFYHSPIGTKHKLAYNKGTNYKDNKFLFAHNQSSPECCPSTYTTDMGCICMTDAQKKLLRTGKGTY